MLFTAIVFVVGVFIGAFVAAFFDFGVKIQFVTGKSAMPDEQDMAKQIVERIRQYHTR